MGKIERESERSIVQVIERDEGLGPIILDSIFENNGRCGQNLKGK
jgi:hypothetical protein